MGINKEIENVKDSFTGQIVSLFHNFVSVVIIESGNI